MGSVIDANLCPAAIREEFDLAAAHACCVLAAGMDVTEEVAYAKAAVNRWGAIETARHGGSSSFN
jgi:hypothetical protein